MVNESVTAAVNALLEDLELDKEGHARAAIARALAAKLDDAALSSSGAVSVATPGIAKELSNTLDAVLATQADTEEFVAGLFGRPA
jgi:hypothetical protein